MQGELAVATVELEAETNKRQSRPDRIASLRTRCHELQSKLLEINNRLEALNIKAPLAGKLCSPVSKVREETLVDKLPTWDGNLFKASNLFARVERGTPIAVIGDPENLQAILKITQKDVEVIKEKSRVVLMAEGFLAERFEGTLNLISVSDTQVEDLPEALAKTEQERRSQSYDAQASKSKVADNAQGSQDFMQERIYQASVDLTDWPTQLIAGTRGQARIDIGYRSSLWHIRRWFSATWRVYF